MKNATYHLLRLQWKIFDGIRWGQKHLVPDWVIKHIGYVLLVPGVILVGFLVLGMLNIFWYSVLTYSPEQFIIHKFTLDNYIQFFKNPLHLKVFWRTFSISVLVTVFAVVFGFPYAYIVVRTRSNVLQKLLLVGLFLPFFTGEIVRAYGWLIILGKHGLVNVLLNLFGIANLNLIYNEFAVMVGLSQIMLPFAVLMLAPAITNINQDMELAAENLGANKFKTLCHIVLPLSAPGLVAASIVVFTLSMTEYAVPALLGGRLVNFSANTIYDTMFHVGDYPFGSALSVILVVGVSALVFCIFKGISRKTLSLH
ncbi:binding-protein-dependent transport systems inner membrane component [Candidatus Vecturithrix granuli]|uniref:Binding-protein-dependent transport systems inner membrane component n=1 Tax=Vecturithrix granuli TaxID=1499967 RepID=A0A081C6A9_VECG1|nr:binding-protein-dependent transport systems inner membrane component [Candidatus Vecturithrix granuli]